MHPINCCLYTEYSTKITVVKQKGPQIKAIWSPYGYLKGMLSKEPHKYQLSLIYFLTAAVIATAIGKTQYSTKQVLMNDWFVIGQICPSKSSIILYNYHVIN